MLSAKYPDETQLHTAATTTGEEDKKRKKKKKNTRGRRHHRVSGSHVGRGGNLQRAVRYRSMLGRNRLSLGGFLGTQKKFLFATRDAGIHGTLSASHLVIKKCRKARALTMRCGSRASCNLERFTIRRERGTERLFTAGPVHTQRTVAEKKDITPVTACRAFRRRKMPRQIRRRAAT